MLSLIGLFVLVLMVGCPGGPGQGGKSLPAKSSRESPSEPDVALRPSSESDVAPQSSSGSVAEVGSDSRATPQTLSLERTQRRFLSPDDLLASIGNTRPDLVWTESPKGRIGRVTLKIESSWVVIADTHPDGALGYRFQFDGTLILEHPRFEQLPQRGGCTQQEDGSIVFPALTGNVIVLQTGDADGWHPSYAIWLTSDHGEPSSRKPTDPRVTRVRLLYFSEQQLRRGSGPHMPESYQVFQLP